MRFLCRMGDDMKLKTKIVQGKYLDSVKLMLISKELRQQEGVLDAVAILANKENREILAATDMLVDEIAAAKETDIVIVIKAESDEAGEAALDIAEQLLQAPTKGQTASTQAPRNIPAAIKSMDGANLCLISVAGKYAAREAEQALDEGLHVMIFSDNVSLEDELRLKQTAISKGLLLMGPDCGTAIVNGCPLGFANAIPRGEIGIVSAAGTGLQEVSVAIANRACGVSQAFGTGGRDGKKAIDGIMLSACLDYLIHDAKTKVIVMIAKTPDPEVREKLWQQISASDKPVIVSFLQDVEHPTQRNLHYSVSLEGCAAKACSILKDSSETDVAKDISPLKLAAQRRYLMGLYSGGTLCYEAQQLYYQEFKAYPKSNAPLRTEDKLNDAWNTPADCFVDLGSDEFTVGRAHPMIDYSLRMKILEQIGQRDDIALIMLDVVLGYGSHPDPASELLPVLARMNKEIPIICHVLGTPTDPQNADIQAEKLREAGVTVFRSHYATAVYAMRVLHEHRRNQ
jgi:FdrA protein